MKYIQDSPDLLIHTISYLDWLKNVNLRNIMFIPFEML